MNSLQRTIYGMRSHYFPILLLRGTLRCYILNNVCTCVRVFQDFSAAHDNSDNSNYSLIKFREEDNIIYMVYLYALFMTIIRSITEHFIQNVKKKYKYKYTMISIICVVFKLKVTVLRAQVGDLTVSNLPYILVFMRSISAG